MKKKALLAVPGGVAIALLAAGPAFGQEFDPSKTTTDVYSLSVSTNILWVVIGAVLVIFMQAGFALVETGFCRAKHAAHVVSTNFAIFGLGFVGFFFIGYPFMLRRLLATPLLGLRQRRSAGASIGSGNWVFLWKGGWALLGRRHHAGRCSRFFLYMVAFMDTTATIPTGAMAERWKWKSFVVWGLFCGAHLLPAVRRAGPGAAAGWPAWDTMHLGAGYVDFAGSGVVHAVGGVAALAGRHRARPPHRQVRQGRQAPHAARPPHPDGDARHVHPAVRLVRLQRRLDAGRDRHPVRRGRRQHRHRRRLRRHRRPCSGSCCGPASPIPA